MQFGICNEIFQNWKIEDAMSYAAKAGYDFIEIAPFTLAKYVTDISSAQRQQARRVGRYRQGCSCPARRVSFG